MLMYSGTQIWCWTKRVFPKNLDNDSIMKLYPLLQNDGRLSNRLATLGAVAAMWAKIYGRTVMVLEVVTVRPGQAT